MRFHPLRNTSRNADLGTLHVSFFIAAVATILCIRTQLWLTNYPQLGGHGLHIAHLLYGGLLMTVAIGIMVSLLGRPARQTAAIVGGIGFGFFIDELGKFITADNNYFFKPAAGIIYLVFVGLFMGSRYYQSRRGLTEAERVRNAIELIAEATDGSFREDYRERALALLDEVDDDFPLRGPLVALANSLATVPGPAPTWLQRAGASVAARYERWSEQPWFQRLVIAVFVVWGLLSILAILDLVLAIGFGDDAARHGFQSDSLQHLDFLNVASLCSTAASAVLVGIGLERLLRHDRVDGYVWLTRALLVSIFITRVFSFVESQFGAVFGLAVDVLLLVSIHLMAGQERRRPRAAAAPRRRPAGGSAAPAHG